MNTEVQCAFCNALMEVRPYGVPRGYFACPSCGHTVLMPCPEMSSGMEIGGFEIQEYLGTGFTGEVFLALQKSMNRPVALKVLAPVLAEETSFIRNFIQQVIRAGMLRHNRIVPIYDAGESDEGIIYVAMRYVEGPSLASLLEEEGALPESKALGLVRPLVQALEYAWREHQILHQDLKPSSILVDENGDPQLVGLGASYVPRRGMFAGHPDLIIGSPHYMSPERVRGETVVDVRTDIYSMGATLYELVTGELPFPGHSIEKVRKIIQEQPVIAPRERNPIVSSGCSRLIEMAMAKKPKHRYLTWQDFLRDLDAVMEGLSPQGEVQEQGPAKPTAAKRPAVGSAPARTASRPAPRAGYGPQTVRIPKSEVSAPSLKKTNFKVSATDLHPPSAVSRIKKKTARQKEDALNGIIIAVLAFGFLAFAGYMFHLSQQEKPKPPAPPSMQEEVGAQIRLRQAENRFRWAEEFAAENPAEIDRIIAKYKAVMETAPQEALVEKARQRITVIQQNRDSQGDR